jgi:hypothetical protein
MRFRTNLFGADERLKDVQPQLLLSEQTRPGIFTTSFAPGGFSLVRGRVVELYHLTFISI